MRLSSDVRAQVKAIPPEKRRCSFHDQTTPEGEPTGNQCESLATHVIEWVWTAGSERRWSFGCADHIGPPGIDPSGAHGWSYEAKPLLDW